MSACGSSHVCVCACVHLVDMYGHVSICIHVNVHMGGMYLHGYVYSCVSYVKAHMFFSVYTWIDLCIWAEICVG